MFYTKDQVVLAAIAEGRRLGITERGIVIGIATLLVETDRTVYANEKVPESMELPHDAVGEDGRSVGAWQQQVVWNPDKQAWWWGDAKTCMDPNTSAALFFARLMKTDYTNTSRSPGSYAQQVQQSAYPDRYDKRMADAQKIYNRLAKRDSTQPEVPTGAVDWFTEHNIIDGTGSSPRGGQRPRLIVLHTEEGNMTGTALDRWMDANEVSYHYIIGNDWTAWDLVDTDLASWSALTANPFTINYVFAPSYAGWSRAEWLSNMGNGIKVAAYLVAADCKKYGIPPVIRVGNGANGYQTLPTQDGITDHNGITVGLRIGNHSDVGPNFPWDVFNNYLQTFYAGATSEEDEMTPDQWNYIQQLGAKVDRIFFELTNRFESRSGYREPGEGPVDTVAGFELNEDATQHEDKVEKLAKIGDADSIRRIIRSAAGEGADQSPEFVKRAKAALKAIPEDVLKAYHEAQV